MIEQCGFSEFLNRHLKSTSISNVAIVKVSDNAGSYIHENAESYIHKNAKSYIHGNAESVWWKRLSPKCTYYHI